MVRDFFEETLKFWGNGDGPEQRTPRPTGLDRVNEALAVVDAALDALGKRDRGGTRAYLNDVRSKLAGARDAFESVGIDFTGPAAVALIERAMAARAAVLSAARALHDAPPDRAVLAEKQAELDLARARAREVTRDMWELRAAVTFPAVPSIEPFKNAKARTMLLRHMARGDAAPARALHEALNQGASASREEARLWICWETSHEVFVWRWRRYEEGNGGADVVAAE
jgi:hypothetical protein